MRRAVAQRKARLDAAEVQAQKAALSATIAAELVEDRGHLGHCGVTRAVVLSDRVFVEVTRERPTLPSMSFVAACAVLLGVIWVTPWLSSWGGAFDFKGQVLALFALVGLPYLLLTGALLLFWRSRVRRIEVPLDRWAAPSGHLIAFVRAFENARQLQTGFEVSNKHLLEAADQVPGVQRRLGHSAFARFRMERKRVRGA